MKVAITQNLVLISVILDIGNNEINVKKFVILISISKMEIVYQMQKPLIVMTLESIKKMEQLIERRSLLVG